MSLVAREDTARSLARHEQVVGRVNPARPIRFTVQVNVEGDTLDREAEQRAFEPLAVHVLAAARAHAAPLAAPQQPLLQAFQQRQATQLAPQQVRTAISPADPRVARAASRIPGGVGFYTRKEFSDKFSAKASDLAIIHRFARRYGFDVVPDRLAYQLAVSPRVHRSVDLVGTVGDVNRAFGVNLVRVRRDDGTLYRTHLGPYQVPAEFDGAIKNVMNLDDRPQLVMHSRLASRLGGTWPAGGYWPTEVAAAYNFPTGVTGAGQTVAIVEFGGGFRYRTLWRYFQKLGMKTMPKVLAVNVGGGRNRPSLNPNGPDGEVLLDIEVAGAVAPGAKFVVYFAPNSSAGFFKALNAVIHDAVNKPNILSISWGQPEGSWTIRDMLSMNDVFIAAEAMGVSVFVAAGDNGSTDGVPGNDPHVDFPASSPWVTGCGGTSLRVHPAVYEHVWNDGDAGGSGGGVSSIFPMPAYQQAWAPSVTQVGVARRGVPDVAGCADPNTGYNVLIDGVETIVGGTSAVAPLWAGLTALLNQSLGYPVGFLNPLLYRSPLRSALNDVTDGNNDTTGRLGLYKAATGWDLCTGFGTPDGAKLLAQLTSEIVI